MKAADNIEMWTARLIIETVQSDGVTFCQVTGINCTSSGTYLSNFYLSSNFKINEIAPKINEIT